MGEFARTTTRDAQPGGRAARDASRALERMREFPAPVTGGRPMEPAVAASFAGLIGRDLSRIRLHDDEFAADLAGALDAEAVTIGDDVYLAADAGELRGSRGRALLAHELAHSASGSEAVGDRAPGQEEATAEMTRPTELADEAIDEGTPRPAPIVVGVPRAARRPVATRSDREAGTPDVVSASEALVRLVDRLLSRDAADTGGRAAAVLGRLQPDVREAVVTTVAAKGGGHLTGDLDRAKHARPPEDGGRPDAPAVEEGAEPERPADESTPAEAATPTGATTKEQTPGTETAAQPQAGAGETLPQAGPSGEGGPEAAGGEPSEQPPAAAAVTAEKGELPAGEGGGPSAVPAEGAAESGGVPAPGGAADAGASPEAAAPENLADTEGAAAAQGADAPLAADAEEPLVEVDTGESDAESVVAPPADAATPEAPTTAEPPATALEPQDPPEISNPPEPENDTAPSLPAPPAPIEDPAAPVADDDSASPLATAPDADLAPEPLDAVSSMEAEAAEPSGRQDAAPAPEGGEGDGAAAPPAPPADDAAGAVLDDPKPPSGGGGGGAAIPDPPATAVPDVSVMQPQAALNSVASLPPTKLSAGLAGVSASASRTVGEAGAELEANPPSMERPSGVPADKDASLPKAPLPPLPPTPKRTVQEVAGGPG
ncbi:MAG: hypothetical protein JWM51_1953, partial [Microbacteriaceae bacterium]|nr:hypothetical protein [Microbacteriaceae bacterium]